MPASRGFAWLPGLIVAGTVWLTAGCGTQPTRPTAQSPTVPIAFIYVSGVPPSPDVSTQFDAVAVDVNGDTRVVTGLATWSSSDSSTLTISATGLATGVRLGAVDVTAAYQGFTDAMLVSVPPIPCPFVNVQPTTPTMPASGGSVVVTIVMPQATPCAWRPTPRVPYVTVSGTASGVGTGSFTLIVAPNAFKARRGYVTVLGKLITISQQ